MANSILWQLAGNIDPLGRYNQGLQQYQKQQTVLQQLAGQEADRQFNRERDQRNFEWQQQESQRSQSNADRAFNAQRSDAASANARADRAYQLQLLGLRQDDVKEVKNADGSTSLVRIPRDPNAPPQPITIPGQTQAPRNPYAPAGKVTDEQAKAAGYANRMAESNDIINSLQGINQTPSGWVGGVVSNTLPAGVANQVVGQDRQKFIQAQRDFINSILRRESGAVISDSEFASARQQYFPQPGDSPEVLKQKEQNRRTALEGIMGAAGPSYTPPKNYMPKQQQGQIGDGAIAVNPQTGQRIRFQNGQWVPAQ